MCWRRHVGMDREGRDVGLVDHQPHPAVGRDLVADPGDEVLGEPVRLELVAVGLGRPRRVEAGPLDGVDGRQVVEPHRLDAQPQRGSRDHATSPLSARDAARQRHVLGHEPGQVVDVAGGQPGRAEPDAARRRGRPGRPRPRSSASSGRASVEVDRDERLAGGAAPAPCRPAAAGRAAPAGRRSRSDGPAGSSRTGRPAARSGAAAPPPVETPTIGSRAPWARPLAVAIPTRSPVNAPGPVPTTMAARRERRDVPLARATRRSPAAASRRGGSRPASRQPSISSPSACRARRPPGSWRCRWPGWRARRPSCASRSWDGRPGSAAGPAPTRPERDRPRLVAGPVDDDVEPLGPAAPAPSRSGHSTSVTPAAWRSSISPPASASVASASRYRSMWKSGSRPVVLGHQDEARRGDRVGHAEARPRTPSPGGSCPPRGRPTGR